MTGIPYTLEHIALKNLSVVWVRSQRPFNPKHANQIADNFDPDIFEPIIVTKPNGEGMYHIVEGQHRKAAADIYLKGDTNQRVPCRVIAEANPARAAEIFLAVNEGRRAIRPVPSFLVAVQANRDIEVNINRIVRKEGYTVGENTSTENTISSVGALKKIYNLYGEIVLRRTLIMCRELWGSDSRGVAGQILSGMALFLNEFYMHVEMAHFKKCIHNQYHSPGNFLGAVRYAKDKTKESSDVSMSELLRVQYNKGRHESKKLKRKET
jgi:Family of unknown function (DUF6551)